MVVEDEFNYRGNYFWNNLTVNSLCVTLCSMKAAMPSPNLTGFTSPVSTSVGDRESYHGNLVVSPGKCYLTKL